MIAHDLASRGEQNLLEIAPDPLPENHFPVHLTLSVGKRTYGEDDGILVLEDGWLHYEGWSCSFNIRGDEAQLGLKHITENTEWIGLKVALDDLTASFRIYGQLGPSKLPIDLRSQCRGTLQGWRYGRYDQNAITLLPPVDAQLSYFKTKLQIATAVFAVFEGFFLILAIVSLTHPAKGSELTNMILGPTMILLPIAVLGIYIWNLRRFVRELKTRAATR